MSRLRTMAWLTSACLVVAVGHAQQPLGALDGEDLPPTDLDRVGVGSVAPDFRLVDEMGTVHQLSDYRDRNIVLVVYRGHW